ncbi:MarR family transcriptional regulator [Mediterraneibacter sp. NSJ-55]|uniref:MarR family transcriptional regulator n=1 Tax=Mediterraneibacter hominis TaxID=2763054 RepID=A0A923RS13_9FIRM|nr:MarR family transcriptional regulator [Mediterraneibacter hominis]MBC5690303.1 MarR family transcriptional regulator [Mediterraneibacter hominis]
MYHVNNHAQLYTELWRETNALYENWARKHSLSYYELLVILSLSEKDVVHTQKNICRRWQLPKQTVNSILKNFIERSWVVLISSEEDKRNKIIVPTKKGKSVITKTSAQLALDEKAVWKSLGKAHADALITGITLYNRFFQEVVDREDT